MTSREKPPFMESKTGILLQVLVVLLPSVFAFNNVFLLAGLVFSTLLAWGMLRLQGKTWSNVGFHKPENVRRLALTTLIATAVLIPLSFAAKHVAIAVTGTTPNLAAFQTIRGNIPALAAGLVIAWLFGAFLEELLLRGFLQNSLEIILLKEGCPRWVTCACTVLLTSACTGIAHDYQGVTGMLVAGFIAVGFSMIYLLNRRNLWSCILAHGLYDTVAFAIVFSGINLDQIVFHT
ncbi:MAG: CPBP family intramembrane metalloprotease [Planctomycetaceae bacterium]|nr:CPBP family intramembrane metalloprotease [Planctomycetaceae bacterium]